MMKITEDDKVALKKEFKQYVSDVVFAIALASGAIFGFSMLYRDKTPTQPSTEVVGNYKECDIIKWKTTLPKYFLYCGENQWQFLKNVLLVMCYNVLTALLTNNYD